MFSENLHSLSFADLNMARLPVTKYTSGGTPYESWIAIGMPRVPNAFIENICYLYETEQEAKSGSRYGGTGFIVGIPSIMPGEQYIYAVTNWHVAIRDAQSCIHVNTVDGKTEVFPFEPHEWEFLPKYDIAVKALSLPARKYKLSTAHIESFATKAMLEKGTVDYGDDVFAVGRFMDHDGGKINRPSLRFGNISVLPFPLKQPNGYIADTFCIDLHCRTGYSGSPVYMYRTPGNDLTKPKPRTAEEAKFLVSGQHLLLFLGILYAQFPEEWEIKEISNDKKANNVTSTGVPLLANDSYVLGLSGMSCVLPAWNIKEVLDMPVFKEARDAAERKLEVKLRGTPSAMGASPVPLSSDENPTHREDFTSLLTAASKTLPQDD